MPFRAQLGVFANPRWSILPILILIGVGCQPERVATAEASEPQSVMREIIEIGRTTSLYADRVDWEALNTELLEMAEGVAEVEGMRPALERFLNAIGDPHGAFRKVGTYEMVAHFTAWDQIEDRDTRERADDVVSIINDIEGKFSFQKLHDDIGYLQLRGISPAADVHTEAEAMRAAIDELHSQGVGKWIVDLRYNGGGNMNPMMAGLASLLGEGMVAGAVDARGEVTQEYSIRDGQFYDWDRPVDPLEAKPPMLGDAKVAVLLSRYTVSSGELVAVAFKGRDRTKFIGEASGGLTTVTGWDVLGDALVMTIGKSIFVDRNGVRYDKHVPVDIEAKFNPALPLTEDEGVRVAAEWLRQ